MKKMWLVLVLLLVVLCTVPAYAEEIESVPSTDAPTESLEPSAPAESPDSSPPSESSEPPAPSEPVFSETDKNITVNVVMPSVETPVEDPAADAPPVEDAPLLDEAPLLEDTPITWSTTKTLDETPAVDAASLSSMVQAVFGEYVPRTQTVTETSSDGSTVTYTECVPGLAGLDWYWISGVALFALVLLSFFKLVGVLFKK